MRHVIKYVEHSQSISVCCCWLLYSVENTFSTIYYALARKKKAKWTLSLFLSWTSFTWKLFSAVMYSAEEDNAKSFSNRGWELITTTMHVKNDSSYGYVRCTVCLSLCSLVHCLQVVMNIYFMELNWKLVGHSCCSMFIFAISKLMCCHCCHIDSNSENMRYAQ